MTGRFIRTELLFGSAAMEKLRAAHVAVFGIGGVGSYVVEALARSGIGKLDIIDNDTVDESNINRQIIALSSTIGQYKVDVARERILDINPQCTVRTYKTFFLPETSGQFDFSQYDYVADAIDTVTGKLGLIENTNKVGTPIISSMGTGNKTDPTALEIADIYDTSVCPLARIIRSECRKRGIEKLKVVYSKEQPLCTCKENKEEEPTGRKRNIPGSTAFVPSVAGLIIAGEIIKDILEYDSKKHK